MLSLNVPLSEKFDEESNTFIVDDFYTLKLEHSLISLSKWEQKFEKPFLSNDEKTTNEALTYIKMMAFEEIPEEIFDKLTQENYQAISEYINAKSTATWFRETNNTPRNREIVTSEIIYFWMTTLGIDMACENWHLNRLFTLIRVVSEKNKPTKKLSRQEIAERNRELNEKRKAQYNTRG